MNVRNVVQLLGRVDTAGASCWEWRGSVGAHGYGTLGKRLAHRVMYELAVGPISPGMTIDHLCRNRRCVRPDHLEQVSQRVNILRSESASAKHARRTSCESGHEFTPENTYVRKDNGARQCRTCKALRERERQRRLRGLAV